MHFAEHVAKATPEPGHKPEPPPQPGPPTWRRKPGDDIETPAWALRCLSTFLAPGTHVYDPFYSTGSVKAHWRKLGYDCTHRRVDYRDPATRPEGLDSGAVTLATYPPSSGTKAFLTSAMLRALPKWAVLVPSAVCMEKYFHDIGHVRCIHVLKPIDFRLDGRPMGSRRRMTWVTKGIEL